MSYHVLPTSGIPLLQALNTTQRNWLIAGTDYITWSRIYENIEELYDALCLWQEETLEA